MTGIAAREVLAQTRAFLGARGDAPSHSFLADLPDPGALAAQARAEAPRDVSAMLRRLGETAPQPEALTRAVPTLWCRGGFEMPDFGEGGKQAEASA